MTSQDAKPWYAEAGAPDTVLKDRVMTTERPHSEWQTGVRDGGAVLMSTESQPNSLLSWAGRVSLSRSASCCLLSLPHYSACPKNTGFSIQRSHLHTTAQALARTVSCPYFTSYCFYLVSYGFDPSLYSHLSKSIFLFSLPMCCSSPRSGSTLYGYGEQMDRGKKTGPGRRVKW